MHYLILIIMSVALIYDKMPKFLTKNLKILFINNTIHTKVYFVSALQPYEFYVLALLTS